MPDFISDGCTLWFDGAWQHCCVDHDLAYYTDSVTLQSHVDLAACVAETSGGPVMGLVMLIGTTAWWLIKHRPWRKRR